MLPPQVEDLETELADQKERMRREKDAEITQVKQAMLEKMQVGAPCV